MKTKTLRHFLSVATFACVAPVRLQLFFHLCSYHNVNYMLRNVFILKAQVRVSRKREKKHKETPKFRFCCVGNEKFQHNRQPMTALH